VLALSLAGLLIGPAVPNTTGRVIMIAPMLQDLIEALGYRPQSKPAAGLAMAASSRLRPNGSNVSHSSATAVMVLAVMPAPAREDVNWITWLPGSPGRHARSRRGIDCPAAFIYDAVGRH